MIRVNNIFKQFDSDAFKKPVEVLKGVSFELGPGKTIGFLGANGAGKTTLMKIMMGFIHQTSGQIEFSPELGKNHLDALKKIGYMPERPYFYPYLKGRDFIKYMGELSRLNSSELNKNAEYWGKRLKIDHAMDREIKGYSKGMLQRLGFMSALIHNPSIIILDEPLSGLDPLGRKEFKDVIREIKNQGKTIFFSSHIVSDLEEVCDDVIFLKNGQIVYEGSLQAVYAKANDIKYEAIVDIGEYAGFQTEDLGGGLTRVHFSKDSKDKFLRTVLDNKAEIIKMNPRGRSLEDVFYFSQGSEQ